jgi:predicted nucleic acid-binding protein
MNEPVLFLDSSAIIAGMISAKGASRALLLLGEDRKIVVAVSEQVITEVERNLARKAPAALPYARELLRHVNLRVLRDPPAALVRQRLDWMSHTVDVPILVAAAEAKVDFLVTLNRRHFIDDPQVAQVSGLRIGTPGDGLAWVREQMRGK